MGHLHLFLEGDRARAGPTRDVQRHLGFRRYFHPNDGASTGKRNGNQAFIQMPLAAHIDTESAHSLTQHESHEKPELSTYYSQKGCCLQVHASDADTGSWYEPPAKL